MQPAYSSKIEYSFFVQVKEHCKDGGMNLIELSFMEKLDRIKGNRALGVK